MQQFSVLMSVYSREHADFLRLALDSVFNQTVVPTEVVLVEDGPLTAELDSVIDEYNTRYAQLKTVKLPVNGGLGRALRAGLRHCSYGLVARMDTDDICRPNRFERQLEQFEKQPELSVCGGWICEFSDDPKKPHSYRKLPEYSSEIKIFGQKRNPVNHMTVMFKKVDVEVCGGYQDYPLFEDYYLWARMLVQGCKFYTIQDVLVDVRADLRMIARRGGLRYARTEVRLQFLFYGLRYIGFSVMLQNIVIRFITRMMPRSVRSWLYKKKLRNDVAK